MNDVVEALYQAIQFVDIMLGAWSMGADGVLLITSLFALIWAVDAKLGRPLSGGRGHHDTP